MIRSINQSEVEILSEDPRTGYFGEYGAVIPDDCESVITEGRTGTYLVPVSEFSSDGGIGVSISKKALLAIGGLPKTESEKLAEELNISRACATDVLYLRTRNRWSQELEQRLIEAHKKGETINVMEFGSTAETQASLYWEASKASREG